MSPYQTGAASISGAMIGAVVVWILGLFHVAAPPDAVAGTIGALVLTAAHFVQQAVFARRAAPGASKSTPEAPKSTPDVAKSGAA